MLGLMAFSFAGMACQGTWFACGAQDVSDMIDDTITNCSIGDTFNIVDLCDPDGAHTYVVTVGELAGPGGGMG